MKKFAYTLTALFILVTSLFSSAQIYDPVDWETSVVYRKDGKVDLCMVAVIEDHWHIYAIELDEGGPIPTEFIIEESPKFTKIGSIQEPNPVEEYDPNFDMQVRYHGDGVKFIQTVEITEDVVIKGNVYFMVCNDEMCLPPSQVDFEFDVKMSKVSAAMPQVEDRATTEPKDNQPVIEETVVDEPTAEEMPAQTDATEEMTEEATSVAEVAEEGGSDKKKESKSGWSIFLFAVAGGLIALVTPCVFPMIPMTVSFFTKQSKTQAEGVRKALIYGFSIIGIYVILSLPFHLFTQISPDIFNEFSTNPVLNVILFAVFIIFSLSFLGAFELVLPSSWINKADSKADKGGIAGIFFMAIVLILVSFTCTGPALAGVLGGVLSTDGGATYVTIAFTGFGLGLAFPFTLFAIFPGWLNGLPKSGGWMNVVKVSLGFIELAFAFKFLSQADLVAQWGILPREIFIAIWLAVFLAWAMYMFNMFRLPHDSVVEKISVGRGMVGLLVLSFVFYLFPGMFGAPLKAIAGMPPPMFYSEAPYGQFAPTAATASASGASHADVPEGSHPETCPHHLNCFHDYETGLAYAKEVGKPVLLDFTGWACVNCRRMEENVWADESVLSLLRDDYVLISLYVDERQELPEAKKYTSETTGKEIKTVGNYWTDFQITNYQSNGQPYYVIVNHESLEPLVEPKAYDPDIEDYRAWLESGIEAFEGK